MRTKRFLGVVLSAVMCLSLLPSFTLTAGAADEGDCTTDSCTGTYTNGFCSVDSTHYEAAQQVSETHHPELNSTHSDYYAIENAGQLYWFADKLNNANYQYVNAILTDNITVNKNVLVSGVLNTDEEAVKAFRVWTPIHMFGGTFEGNGKTVSGLYFSDSSTSDDVGLFGEITADNDKVGIVRNISVADSYFHGYYTVGGVVGRGGNAKITNCHNAAYVGGEGFVGGIVGYNFATVTNCSNTGTVNATMGGVGGVIGRQDDGTVENCYNIGSVSGMGFFGGAVGMCEGGTVINCYYLDSSCTSVGGGGTAKTAEHFKSGEVAYLLGSAWGQTIGTDSYPVFGGMKVILENDTYKNQVTEFEIISLSEDKKSANVAFPTAGNYTLILADYEESRLNNLDTIIVVAENDNTIKTVTSEKDITLGIGDKVMLWKDMKTITPLCEAYIVK